MSDNMDEPLTDEEALRVQAEFQEQSLRQKAGVRETTNELTSDRTALMADVATELTDTRTIDEVWRDGERQRVIECLARDESPGKGWDKRFPDLAAQRKADIATVYNLALRAIDSQTAMPTFQTLE